MWHFKKNEQDDENRRTDIVWVYIPRNRKMFKKRVFFFWVRLTLSKRKMYEGDGLLVEF